MSRSCVVSPSSDTGSTRTDAGRSAGAVVDRMLSPRTPFGNRFMTSGRSAIAGSRTGDARVEAHHVALGVLRLRKEHLVEVRDLELAVRQLQRAAAAVFFDVRRSVARSRSASRDDNRFGGRAHM